jgi:hypothetical protein
MSVWRIRRRRRTRAGGLIYEFGVEFASALIVGKRPVPIGGLVQRVPGRQHRPGPFGVIEAEKKVCESQDGAATLVAPPSNGFWQCVVGAVRKRVAVDDEEGKGHLLRRCSFSGTISMGFLSSRKPRNAGCRISPPLVHSVNFTSATSLGFTQVVVGSSFTRCLKGDEAVRSGQSFS